MGPAAQTPSLRYSLFPCAPCLRPGQFPLPPGKAGVKVGLEHTGWSRLGWGPGGDPGAGWESRRPGKGSGQGGSLQQL